MIDFNQDDDKREAGLYRKKDNRFDELFEPLKFLKVDLKELPVERIQKSLVDEAKEILRIAPGGMEGNTGKAI